MFSVCPQLKGVRVKGQSSLGGSKVNPAGGWSKVQPGGAGSKVNPAGGGGSGPASGARGGQHLLPSCGRYASCVHTGGLSCR